MTKSILAVLAVLVWAGVAFGQSQMSNPYVRPACTATVTTNCTPQVDGGGAYVPAVVGAGLGDVVGPAKATDGNLAVFDTTTGKLLKDGGAIPSTTGLVAGAAALTTVGAIPRVSAAGTLGEAASSNVVALWASGKCAGALLADGTCDLLAFQPRNGNRNVTITTDTILESDEGKWITYSNAGAIAATFPCPSGGTFPAGWKAHLKNANLGTVTLTATGGCWIDNVAITSIVLTEGKGAIVESNGTNLFSMRSVGAGTSGGVLYFSDVYTQDSSLLLADGALMVGGGAGAAPETLASDIGVVKLTKGVPSGAASTDVVALWTMCSGYLKSDGACDSGDGTGTDDQTAAEVANTPAGNIEAITVQAALNELDTEKQPADADLTAVAALACTENQIIKRNGAGAWVCAADAVGEPGAGDVSDVGDCGGAACFTSAGSGTTLTFHNATSGTIALTPVAGALGTVTLNMPAADGTLARLSDIPATIMTQTTENSADNSVSVGVGTSGRAFESTPVTIDPSTGVIGGTVSLSGNASTATTLTDGDKGAFTCTSGTCALDVSYQAADAALTALAAGSDFVDFAGPTTAAKTFTLPDADANVMTMGTANDTDNAIAVAVGTSGAAFEKTPVTINPSTGAIAGVASMSFGADPADAGILRISNNTTALASEIATPGTDMTFGSNASDEWESNAVISAPGFRTTSTGAAGLLGLLQGTACTPETNEVCVYAPASVTAYGLLLPGAVGSTGVLKVSVSGSVATYSHAALVDNDIPDDITITGMLTNPMTTAEDIIVGGTAGAPARLAVGSEGQALKIVSGVVAWGTDSTGGSPAFSDVGAGTNANALVVGTDGSLTVSGTGTINATSLGGTAAASYALLANPVFTGSLQLPNGGPTIDAAGEIGVDTTSDQLQFYGAAKRALPSIQSSSLVISAPADTDDLFIMKAPYAMTILTINGIVGAATNVVGQLQECAADGTSCADLDSDITFDTDGAADDGSLTDSAIASGAWIKWKTTSVSGTPGHLAVTFTFRVVPD